MLVMWFLVSTAADPMPEYLKTKISTAFHGSDFMGERLTVQFARGTRNRDAFAATERTAPRPRRTPHRMQISGLPGETSWQVCNPRSFIRTIGSQTCYLDSAQHHIWTASLYSDPFVVKRFSSPGQHQAPLWLTVPLQCASAFA